MYLKFEVSIELEIRNEVVNLHICVLHANGTDGESLQFASRKKVDVSIRYLPQLCRKYDLNIWSLFHFKSSDRLGLLHTQNVHDFIEIVKLSSFLNQFSHFLFGSLDGLWDLIYILRLHHRFQIILQYLCEVILFSSD